MTRRTSLLIVGLLWIAVAATLALSALPVHGQPVTFPLAPCVDRPTALTVPAPGTPPGKPAQWGGQCSTHLHTSTVGAAALMLCPRPGGGTPLVGLYAVRWSALTPAMAGEFAALPFQPAASAVEFQRKYATQHVLDMCDVWGPARERWNAAYAAATTPVQPAPQWLVAIFGVQDTRPAFTVVAGKRGPQATTRAPVTTGQAPNKQRVPCDCSAPVVEGATTYCPWRTDAGPVAGFVTVCVRTVAP